MPEDAEASIDTRDNRESFANNSKNEGNVAFASQRGHNEKQKHLEIPKATVEPNAQSEGEDNTTQQLENTTMSYDKDDYRNRQLSKSRHIPSK